MAMNNLYGGGVGSAGHFELSIDGAKSTHYLKSVEGGWIKAAEMKESVGRDNIQIKHHSTVEIEPFACEMGMAATRDVMKWLKESRDKQWCYRSGEIAHGNMNMKIVFLHQFKNALLTEVGFPACDAKSKETAYLKLKMLAQTVETSAQPGTTAMNAWGGPKQKQWSASAFRFHVDGVPDSDYVSKVDAFTIKQGVNKTYTGKHRFPTIVPSKLEIPGLSGTINMSSARGFLDWYQATMAMEVGSQADKAEKEAVLEFLSPDYSKAICRIRFHRVGLTGISVLQSQANAESTKALKFDLSVEDVTVDDMSGMDDGSVTGTAGVIS